jgi:hypothetical protein
MDYALLDSGEGEKLERFGDYVIRRPDPQALWERVQPSAVWDACDAWFERKGEKGEWHFNKTLPKEWELQYGGLIFGIRLTSFKHVGISSATPAAHHSPLRKQVPQSHTSMHRKRQSSGDDRMLKSRDSVLRPSAG